MTRAEIEAGFPLLVGTAWRQTSLPTSQYNCIGWAADDNSKWWWPTKNGYWPAGVPRALHLNAFVDAYATLGYVVCADGVLVEGLEKIAIYVANNVPTHAARQLETGQWTSKLGHGDDICHDFDGVSGAVYGAPAVFMQRPRRD